MKDAPRVTRKEFEKYEQVRASSRINMMNIHSVQQLTGLSVENIHWIQSNYRHLRDEVYPITKRQQKRLGKEWRRIWGDRKNDES